MALVPGLHQDDQVLLAQGYGVREIGKSEKIDSESLFKIASNSKAFTTAALAALVAPPSADARSVRCRTVMVKPQSPARSVIC